MNTTHINGIELKEYDNFRELVSIIEKDIISQKEYAGYPKLPERDLEAYEIYKRATKEEREWIFSILWSYFISALRHWKVDLDALWTEDGRKKHEEFLNKYKPLLPYMKKEMDSFYIGIG